jgi:hypothetical protein
MEAPTRGRKISICQRSRSTLERERERESYYILYKSSKKFLDQIFTENKLQRGAGASFLFFKEFQFTTINKEVHYEQDKLSAHRIN